jgi:hypothetical protein
MIAIVSFAENVQAKVNLAVGKNYHRLLGGKGFQ